MAQPPKIKISSVLLRFTCDELFRWGDALSTADFCKAYAQWETKTAACPSSANGEQHGRCDPPPPDSRLEPNAEFRVETETGTHGTMAVHQPTKVPTVAPADGRSAVRAQEVDVVDNKSCSTTRTCEKTPVSAACGESLAGSPSTPPRGSFDFILAGDVLYKQDLLVPFLSTVDEMMAPQGRLLLCHVPRAGVTHDIVEGALAAGGFAFEVVSRSKEQPEDVGAVARECEDVGGVELCMDDARRARLYSVTRI